MTFYEKTVETMAASLFTHRDKTERIILAKQLMDKNPKRKLTIAEISASVFMSQYHFIRSFKILYGVSPGQYAIEARMHAAKKLMANGNDASSACFAIGYKSLSTFSRVFKKRMGRPPKFAKKAILDKLKT